MRLEESKRGVTEEYVASMKLTVSILACVCLGLSPAEHSQAAA